MPSRNIPYMRSFYVDGYMKLWKRSTCDCKLLYNFIIEMLSVSFTCTYLRKLVTSKSFVVTGCAYTTEGIVDKGVIEGIIPLEIVAL